jgi:hypothetical protein
MVLDQKKKNNTIWSMHSNVMSPRSINVIFQRLGFVIQKGLAS